MMGWLILFLWLCCGAWAAWYDADGRDPREWNSHDWLGAIVKTVVGPIAIVIVGAGR